MLTGRRGILATVVAALLGVAIAGAVPSTAVINGDSTDTAQFPFLVALAGKSAGSAVGGRYDAFCGGTLVAPRKVITAAHCARNPRWVDGESVVIAATGGSLESTDAQVSVALFTTVHPSYNSSTIANDIAVVTLATPIIGLPLATPSSDDSSLTGGQEVWSAGWGLTSQSPEVYPDMFRVAPMVVFPEASCGVENARNYTVNGQSFRGYSMEDDVYANRQICAEGFVDGRIVDTCFGDSGGPLVAGSGQATRLVGVVSWGPNACASEEPGVYTRVSYYRDFLSANGVKFAGPSTAMPATPAVISVTPGATRLTVKLRASVAGDRPEALWATARDGSGHSRSCVVAAPQATANINCTITGLRTGVAYRVTSYAIAGWNKSARTEAVIGRPASAPEPPRITSIEIGSHAAKFTVRGFIGNGSRITEKFVRCAGPGDEVLRAAVGAEGRARVTGMTSGARYTCAAVARNALGTGVSTAEVVRTI